MKRAVCLLVGAVMVLLLGSALALGDVEVHFHETPPDDWNERNLFRLTMFRTTYNDAMLLECGGQTMIVDSGTKKWTKSLLRAYREKNLVDENGNVHVDRIFISHPHDDHVGGAIRMVENGLTADEYLTNIPRNFKDDLHRKAIKTMEKHQIPIHFLEQNEILTMGDAELRVFWYSGYKDLNQASAIIHVRFGDATLLLTGDAVNAAQRGLLREWPVEYLRSDVMKAPHHAINACEKAFLEAVNPKLVFASAQRDQISETVNQMKTHGIPLVCHTLGRIVLETDGTVWYVEQYRDTF